MKLLRHLALLLVFSITAVAQNDLPAMKPITSRHTPAWKAAKKFMRGVNLANFLEVPPGQHWFVHHTIDDLKEIRAQGFDHIRLPVAWHCYTGAAPDYRITGDIFDRADEIVTNATALGLNVIVNVHNFNEFTKDPATNTERFYSIWRQVAAHYAHAPAGVAFELLNEPHDAATTLVMNPIYAETVRQIRQTNPRRTIFVGPGHWNSPDELTNFWVPKDDNLIVTLHCYEPFFFTHQGATWTTPDVRHLKGICYPGPPKAPYNIDPDVAYKKWILNTLKRYDTEPTKSNPSGPKAFLPKIQEAKAWSEKWGRPIHFGEFGAFMKADQDSRANYYAAMRRALEAQGIGWAIWDWKSGFNYWNPKTQEPLPGMREALFSGPALPTK